VLDPADEPRAQARRIVLLCRSPSGKEASSVSTVTLVTKRLYFGIPALRLRDATERIVSRLATAAPQHPLGLEDLAQEFSLGTGASRLLAEQMVRKGLLERLSAQGIEFRITDRFKQYALARIVDPLPRTRAQLLLSHVADLAEHFNRTAVSNKYEIEVVAVFGAYMSRESELPELSLGVTGRLRAPGSRGRAGRATTQTEGTDQIRAMLQDQHTLVRVSFFHKLTDIPRPFSVAFRDNG
jgi:hypothetical protein